MRHHYGDILERIDEPPAWFDEQGVPRYGAFAPYELGNVYAREAALAEISCQDCGRPFTVAMDDRYGAKGHGLCDRIRLGRLHYGDPPNVGCCDAGATMNSVMHRVLEYWSFDTELGFEWKRDPAYEGPVPGPCDPADAVSEVLAAVDAGHTTIGVRCTSGANRYDLAGRVTAALAGTGRVLVVSPMEIAVVVGRMLDGLVPSDAIGHLKQSAPITLASFGRLAELLLGTIGTIIVLTGTAPRLTHGRSMTEDRERSWRETRWWLEDAAIGRLLIECRLAGRRTAIETPGIVVDGWRLKAPMA